MVIAVVLLALVAILVISVITCVKLKKFRKKPRLIGDIPGPKLQKKLDLPLPFDEENVAENSLEL